MKALSFVFFLLVSLLGLSCLAQVSNSKKSLKVSLVNWSSENCDNTYDPYLLKNRITNIETKEGITSITVSFSDNCCVKFEPKIQFKNNRLILIPYEGQLDLCACDCCFSLRFQIAGLEDLTYKVYFREKQVELSQDHYEVKSASFEVYKNRTINRTNKYGFKEGLWMSFYDDGKQKRITEYPESSLYSEPYLIWSKEYYKSGKLSKYQRKDTTEWWFQDGEMKSQHIEYKSQDTTITRSFRKFENRRIEEKYLEKFYPFVFKSDFDPYYKSTGAITEIIYKEEYYENGQLKYLYGKDTSYAWHENGRIKSKNHKDGSIEFDEQGHLLVESFHWKVSGSKGMGDLENSMYVEFYKNGNIKKVLYVRDEPQEDNYISPNVRYEWEWDQNSKPVATPEKWNEEFPWKRYPEIKL